MGEFQPYPDHSGMSVSDLENAVGWFDRLLGFKLERRADMAGCRIAFVQSTPAGLYESAALPGSVSATAKATT